MQMAENNVPAPIEKEVKEVGTSAGQEELLALLGKKRKRSIPKYLPFIAAALAAALGVGIFGYIKSRQSNESETVFRQYTVQRGDVVVGTTES